MIGILAILLVVVALFAFKVTGSEKSIYVDGCTPYNVQIQKGDEENTVEILWLTKDPCSGYTLYGKEMRGLEMVGVDLKNSAESKEHIVILKDLVTTKRYYFSIVSNEVSFGKDGLPLQFSIESL